jgi:TfoX/Sxy family transcriptional regulator of competence genes
MPKWRPAPDELKQVFEKAIQSFPEAEPRKVFGYPAAVINGHMFAGLHQEDMILRLGEVDRAQLLKRPGAKLFEPMPGRPMREYVVVPPAILKSAPQLNNWLEKALTYTRSLPPKAPKTSKLRAAKA